MPGTPFSLSTDLVGGHLTIDGVPIPDDHIMATEVVVTPNDPTRLIVHVRAQGVIEGEGIIETVRDGLTGDRVRALSADKIRAEFAARSRGLGQSAAAVYRDIVADMVDQAAGQ